MKRNKLIVLCIFLLALVFYFIFFHKNKTLKFIPGNADVVVLLDVKKLGGQYIYSLTTHPSLWFDEKKKRKDENSLRDSGVKIPDFLQIFHLKNTGYSDWYSVIEVKDHEKFLAFLKIQKFVNKGKNTFQKDQFFLKIDGEKCILGTSDLAFENINQQLFRSSGKKNLNADKFIDDTVGSISFISGEKIRNFSIELNADDIEIKNTSKIKAFNSILAMAEQKTSFLEMELDAANVKTLTGFFNKSFSNSSEISYIRASAELEQVNDTIISYGYDDNFNEVEKKTYQKIIQPNYVIELQSKAPEKTWEYFRNKKWINPQNQFTVIPFQPNNIARNKNGFEIKSTRKTIPSSQKLKENFIFIKYNNLLVSSISTLSVAEKKIISEMDYIFYGNKAQDYYVKLKARKGGLPLILRW
ncbi:hypothetical protein [Chryseobacterium populi]|uniref:DUF4340 domain-containing protein n=1 Tax=Chryseobacterium populi TaxID=1144316 RepID=J2KCB2_9FLAO|nr:hypothetical protein [Chryseobacterium populi]EJL70803.1 hypothetical protein PMI13_02665 [Chryseobacterium populi]